MVPLIYQVIYDGNDQEAWIVYHCSRREEEWIQSGGIEILSSYNEYIGI